MKNKLLKSLMICLIMCLSVGLFIGCSMPGAKGGGSVADMIEDPDSGDYSSGEDYKSVGELYTGFNMVVGTDGNLMIHDNITNTIMNFNDLLDRQITLFVRELIARLNLVWGEGEEGTVSLPVTGTSLPSTGIYIKIDKKEGISGGSLDDAESYKSDLTVEKTFNDVIVINSQNEGVRYTWDADKNAYVQATDQTLRGLSFYNAISGGKIFERQTIQVWNGTSVESISDAYVLANGSGWSNNLDNAEGIMKNAIAKILAYGDANHSGTYTQALADIDHLGFLTVEDDEDNSVTDEVEKIIEYILNEIIGEDALAQDDVARNAFASNNISTDWKESVLAQNYKAYKVLVPDIVTSMLDSELQQTDMESYKAYPSLPRATTDRFLFPEPEPKEDEDDEDDDEFDFDLDGSEDTDFISMDDYKEIKSITFMPREDAPVVAFMLAFEAKGRDTDGSLKDIKVELEVRFTIKIDGKFIMQDEVVSGLGAENGKVVINPGVYDGESNDNSAMFNVSNKVKQLLSEGKITDAEGIPENGIVTVKQYDGRNPIGVTSLYNEDYTTIANPSGVGSVAGLESGDNYIQIKFSIVNAVKVQGTTEEPFNGTVLLKLMVGDPIS